MNGEVKKPITTLLEQATTVGELIKQLQQFDEKTPFTPYQRILHVKVDNKECICFTEVNELT